MLASRFEGSHQVTVHMSAHHVGFAMGVKCGLEMCTTTYALILQHDRAFTRHFCGISRLINAMEADHTIRYIGFPTSTSSKHHLQILTRYSLGCLNDRAGIEMSDAEPHGCSQCMGPNRDAAICGDPARLRLQPLIFWYDSNHLAHCGRYLEIFKGVRAFPMEFCRLFGWDTLKMLKLRKG